jgi:hypothetical protein
MSGEPQLRETSGRLILEYGPSSAQQLGELYRDFAVLCVEKQYRQALVLAGEDRRAGELALRSAMTMMLLAGIPRDFKLALVTTSTRVAAAYRAAGRDLCAAGLTARLFDNQRDAALWLDGLPERASSSAWQAAPPALA